MYHPSRAESLPARFKESGRLYQKNRPPEMLGRPVLSNAADGGWIG